MGQPISEDDMRLFGVSESEIQWINKVNMYLYGTLFTVLSIVLLCGSMGLLL